MVWVQKVGAEVLNQEEGVGQWQSGEATDEELNLRFKLYVDPRTFSRVSSLFGKYGLCFCYHNSLWHFVCAVLVCKACAVLYCLHMYVFQHKHTSSWSEHGEASLWFVDLFNGVDTTNRCGTSCSRLSHMDIFHCDFDHPPNSYFLKTFIIPQQWVIALLLAVWFTHRLRYMDDNLVSFKLLVFFLPFPFPFAFVKTLVMGLELKKSFVCACVSVHRPTVKSWKKLVIR